MESATLAGGCFWCTEAIFKRLKGVTSVTSGYAIGSDQLDYAEAIQIEFDPKVIPYEHLLDIFWATHDPTSLNKQGYDIGTQYRSAIFYDDEQQKQTALKSKQEMESSSAFDKSIVTEISALKKFTKAEDFHQDFYDKNKNSIPYCSLIIDPKIRKLLDKFNSDVKAEYKN